MPAAEWCEGSGKPGKRDHVRKWPVSEHPQRTERCSVCNRRIGLIRSLNRGSYPGRQEHRVVRHKAPAA